jgi:hypothetical protein
MKLICPAALIFKFAVQSFPSLGLFLGIEQGEFRSLDDGDISPVCNFQQAQDVLSLFLHPLVAADSGNAEDIKLFGLQKNQNGLLVAGPRPPGVLINNDLDLLRWCKGFEEEDYQQKYLREITHASANDHFLASFWIANLRAD